MKIFIDPHNDPVFYMSIYHANFSNMYNLTQIFTWFKNFEVVIKLLTYVKIFLVPKHNLNT